MIGRLLWFVLGAGFALWALSKVRGYLRLASPQAVGHRMVESAAGIGESARDFSDRVRAAMAEREAELRDALGLPE